MKRSASFVSEVFKKKTNKMATSNDSFHQMAHQISQISLQLQEYERKREELEQRVDAMGQHDGGNGNEALYQNNPSNKGCNSIIVNDNECNEPDINPTLTSGDQIQLESYKAIPEYSGKKHEYRSWRNQVARRMKIINDFKDHPKYEAALAIVRAKITGAAADVLTNNKTPYNIICILRTLDSAYVDRRPLYAIEAEMVSIKQNEKTLQQYYNAINFALNAIIAKVTMSYKTVMEQQSLITEAQKKAIRTFIVGLKFRTMRHILYGQQPGTLSEAYSIAQTVHYDNEHLQLEQCFTGIRTSPPRHERPYTNANKARNDWYQPRANNVRNGPEPINRGQWNRPRNNEACNGAEPMDVDGSNRTKQTNWHKQDIPQKREYHSTRQRFEQPPQQKMQRINRLMETTEPTPDGLTSSEENDSDDSTATNMSSAFLDEMKDCHV